LLGARPILHISTIKVNPVEGTWEVFIPWQGEVVRHHEPIAYDEKNFTHYMNKRNMRIMKAEPRFDLRISTTGI
jgi:hypothetical protein